MTSGHQFKRFTMIIIVLIIAIAAAVFFFWQVDAEEQAPKVSKTELIESNKVWINNQMQIPIQDKIILSIPATNTNTTIASNGDLILETTNEEILKELASSDNRYKILKHIDFVLKQRKFLSISLTQNIVTQQQRFRKSSPIMKLQVVNVLYRQKKRLYK